MSGELSFRAGTGFDFTGSGRARASDIGLDAGSGLAILHFEPVGLGQK